MKNRIGFGVRQTECRHQSQNALIFNNPHLHVYKWYNQELLMLILPLPNRSWHRSWCLQTAWEARGRTWCVWPCGGSSPDESSRLIKNTWRIASLPHRSLELIVVGQDEIWHDRSCLLGRSDPPNGFWKQVCLKVLLSFMHSTCPFLPHPWELLRPGLCNMPYNTIRKTRLAEGLFLLRVVLARAHTFCYWNALYSETVI